MDGLKDKTILYITNDYFSFTKDQIETLAPFFKQVYVFPRYKPVAELSNWLPINSLKRHRKQFWIDLRDKPDNVTVVPVPLWYLPTDRGYRKLGEKHLAGVLKYINRYHLSFDLVHAHFLWSSGYVGLRLKEQFGKPFVVTAHRYDIYDLPYRSDKWLASIRQVLTSADATITVSTPNVASLRKLLPLLQPILIPNGFDQRLFFPQDKRTCREKLGLPQNAQLLLSIGSLEPYKGQLHLVDALARLAATRPDLMCVLIGDGGLKSSLQRRIRAAGLESRFRLIGSFPHHEIPVWMNAADVFVLPSLHESFGVVQLEALACGVPVVATANDGSRSVITSPEHGLLCRIADPSDLAAKLTKALEKPWVPTALRTYAEQYRWDSICQQIIDVYRSILNRKRELPSTTH